MSVRPRICRPDADVPGVPGKDDEAGLAAVADDHLVDDVQAPLLDFGHLDHRDVRRAGNGEREPAGIQEAFQPFIGDAEIREAGGIVSELIEAGRQVESILARVPGAVPQQRPEGGLIVLRGGQGELAGIVAVPVLLHQAEHFGDETLPEGLRIGAEILQVEPLPRSGVKTDRLLRVAAVRTAEVVIGTHQENTELIIRTQHRHIPGRGQLRGDAVIFPGDGVVVLGGGQHGIVSVYVSLPGTAAGIPEILQRRHFLGHALCRFRRQFRIHPDIVPCEGKDPVRPRLGIESLFRHAFHMNQHAVIGHRHFGAHFRAALHGGQIRLLLRRRPGRPPCRSR